MHAPLSTELTRLYRLEGDTDSQPLPLVSAAGLTRTLILEFRRSASQAAPRHWDHLCRMANYLQDKLGLPAPAVSISGNNAYRLWLSLAQPVPLAQAHAFLQALCTSNFPDLHADELDWLPQADSNDASDGSRIAATAASYLSIECPPCLQSNGLWSAFIHPGMGAAFEEEGGLEMPPPAAGQAAFLERLRSISTEQWTHSCATLQKHQPATAATDSAQVCAPASTAPAGANAQAEARTGTLASAAANAMQSSPAANPGLLLRDATLDDIIRHLHERNIEPTFRHLLPSSQNPAG